MQNQMFYLQYVSTIAFSAIYSSEISESGVFIPKNGDIDSVCAKNILTN
jgi:hypothetical protein